jgi:hypothetical protein
MMASRKNEGAKRRPAASKRPVKACRIKTPCAAPRPVPPEGKEDMSHFHGKRLL